MLRFFTFATEASITLQENGVIELDEYQKLVNAQQTRLWGQYQKEQQQKMEQHQKEEQQKMEQYQKEQQQKMEQYQKEQQQNIDALTEAQKGNGGRIVIYMLLTRITLQENGVIELDEYQKLVNAQQTRLWGQYQKEQQQKMEQHQKEEQQKMEQYQKEQQQKMEQYQKEQQQNIDALTEAQKGNGGRIVIYMLLTRVPVDMDKSGSNKPNELVGLQ
ncbi:hypothetical protein GPALN_012059 [Globodera pallida]|nr:hypothetical protein GPALN_012059 [Globodera pallida]